MNAPIRRLRRALPLAAALLLAVPAAAQRQNTRVVNNGETRIINDNGTRRMELRSRGVVHFNDEGDWVQSVEPGGMLTVEESGLGPDRRLEFRPGDGGVRVTYQREGRERPLDAEARTWGRRLIGEAVRESGLGAAARVARLRRQGGVGAVLQDMARLESDTGRRMYYHALLASGAMSAAEFARVMDDVGRRMQSDTETRLVLNEAVQHAGGAGRLAALLRAAEGIGSDTETRLVLNHVASRHRLSDAASRDAFFRAVGGIQSDTETRLVLNAYAEQRLADGPSRDAFFRAVGGIGSDVERRLVLSEVLTRSAPEATVVAALRTARDMDSDVEKRLVLYQVPASLLRNGRVTAAYRQVVETMDSDSERSLALRRLVDGN